MEVHRPDYAITKPSMAAVPPKKAKIIRTYGRQGNVGAAESQSEGSALKRRRIDTTPPALSDKTERTSLQHASSAQARVREAREVGRNDLPRDGNASEPVEKNHIKGSILSFFKPVAKQPSEPESTLSSTSLPSKQEESRPRLLKLSSTSSPIRKPSKRKHNTHESQEDAELEDDRSARSPRRKGPRSGQPRRVLSDGGAALHNRGAQLQVSTITSRSETEERDKLPAAAPAKPTVQTTLNISCQAAFSECKTCDTVWNPLYPDDVQLHKNRHAACLRERRKRERAEF